MSYPDKIFIKVICSLFIITTASLSSQAKIHYSAQQYIKNYAFSTCIAQGYRGYLEFGEHSLSAHTAVRELGQKFLA